MWLELVIGSLLGIGLGVISGLFPGVHSNTMAALLLALQPLLVLYLGPVAIASALISTLVTHTFLDIIPSTLLGIPDADTALSVLPAHRLCLAGRGEEAIRISALGSALGAVISLPVFLLLISFLPSIQGYIDWWAGILIIFVAGLLIAGAEAPHLALVLFVVSGSLGVFSLRYSHLAWNGGASGILMPLLSGLFGMAALLTASHGRMPPQTFTGMRVEGGRTVKGAFLGTLAGSMVGWLPGLSSATANGLIASFVQFDREGEEYILATSAANTANAIIGIAAFAAVGRTRNGVMAALSAIETPSVHAMLVSALLAATCAFILTILLSGSASWVSHIDMRSLNIGVMIFVVALTLAMTGPFGLLVLVCATLLGLVPPLLNVPRLFLMGSVMLPVILFSFQIPIA